MWDEEKGCFVAEAVLKVELLSDARSADEL
jgi:hypothetical protein